MLLLPIGPANTVTPAHTLQTPVPAHNPSINSPHKNQMSPRQPNMAGKPVKKVGFAPAPTEDLRKHHLEVRRKEEELKKYNTFHKVPPELQYLEKKARRATDPKPLPAFVKNKMVPPPLSHSVLEITLGDLKQLNIKIFCAQNKDTEFNFHYPVINRPIATGSIMVDVKYAAIGSYELGKLPYFNMNLNDVPIGLGYQFAGEIQDLGKNFLQYDLPYKIAQKVYGIVYPLGHQGSLSTSIVVSPTRDIIIPITDEDFELISKISVAWDGPNQGPDLEFQVDDDDSGEIDDDLEEPESSSGVDLSEPKEDMTELAQELAGKANVSTEKEVGTESESVETPITSDSMTTTSSKSVPLLNDTLNLPTLAKFVTFPTQYCRARCALEHFPQTLDRRINVLINGADTYLGKGIIQLLNSQLYDTVPLNVIMVVRDSHLVETESFIKPYTKGKYYGPSRERRYSVIAYDIPNEARLAPEGEVTYKKSTLVAGEILDAMLTAEDHSRSISIELVNDYKIDYFIDICGGKLLHLMRVLLKRLEEMSFPWLTRISTQTSLHKMFPGAEKADFLLSILKKKTTNTAYVACCSQMTIEPSYLVKETIREEAANLWNMKWSNGMANSLFSTYNYYENISMPMKEAWVREGLIRVLNGEFRPIIDGVFDWREDMRSKVNSMWKEEKNVVFEVEDF